MDLFLKSKYIKSSQCEFRPKESFENTIPKSSSPLEHRSPITKHSRKSEPKFVNSALSQKGIQLSGTFASFFYTDFALVIEQTF